MPKKTPRHKHQNRNTLSQFLRRPLVQVGILAIIALVVFIIAILGNQRHGLPAEISADQAYQKYQQGAFLLDVRTVEEWNEYHVPNTTLIPLDQLPARLNELPRDREIVVICRSGNRSQQGRDILLQAGFSQVTSMAGGLKQWSALGYPIEGTRP